MDGEGMVDSMIAACKTDLAVFRAKWPLINERRTRDKQARNSVS